LFRFDEALMSFSTGIHTFLTEILSKKSAIELRKRFYCVRQVVKKVLKSSCQNDWVVIFCSFDFKI